MKFAFWSASTVVGDDVLFAVVLCKRSGAPGVVHAELVNGNMFDQLKGQRYKIIELVFFFFAFSIGKDVSLVVEEDERTRDAIDGVGVVEQRVEPSQHGGVVKECGT